MDPDPAPDGLDALLDRLGEVGAFTLPPLTRDELRALEDRPALADVDDDKWWSGLAPATRTEVLGTAQRGLLARQLATLSDDPGRLLVEDPVRLVLAVRSSPSVIVVASDPEQSHARAVRAYGIERAGDRPDALLLESRLVPGISEFVVGRPEVAAGGIARFLLEPPTDVGTPEHPPEHPPEHATVVVRRLEVLHAPSQEGAGTSPQRHIVLSGATAARISRVDEAGRAGDPEPIDDEGLAALVLDLLASPVRR